MLSCAGDGTARSHVPAAGNTVVTKEGSGGERTGEVQLADVVSMRAGGSRPLPE
jgi:hypothetical protein